MVVINSIETLNAAVIAMEEQHRNEGMLLRENLHEVYETMKPINLIRGVLGEVAAAPEAQSDLVKSAMGLAAGYAAKMLIEALPDNAAKKLVGSLVLFGVSSSVSKNAGIITFAAKGLFSLLTSVNKTVNQSK